MAFAAQQPQPRSITRTVLTWAAVTGVIFAVIGFIWTWVAVLDDSTSDTSGYIDRPAAGDVTAVAFLFAVIGFAVGAMTGAVIGGIVAASRTPPSPPAPWHGPPPWQHPGPLPPPWQPVPPDTQWQPGPPPADTQWHPGPDDGPPPPHI